ncbi:2-hydroxyhepta-2,4-diene-1,7-dioate isomerase [Aspergillus pseudodeflectus]|uniref:Fumarylacetoacetase n=1 Tax=Aspergillus pseudodeflectus TaxID=176178 RepID=A0ABR4KGH6_9EURO
MPSSSARSPFTLENIPYGVITTLKNPSPKCATAFEDSAVDLSRLECDGFFAAIPGFPKNVFSQSNLNKFALLPREIHAEVRKRLIGFLSTDLSQDDLKKYLIPLVEVENQWPMATANFSDFYCSLEHAENCSELFGMKVSPNWYSIPTVYNGRTSSLKVSKDPIRRPWGMGIFLSKPLPAGQILDIRHAKEYIFGFVILNDWSARDIQTFEMAPLGPFHGKGCGTTISPWIVTLEALEVTECSRTIPQSPPPLSHLAWKGPEERATFNIELTAKILRNGRTYHVTSTNLRELYWSPYQQLAHLPSAGEGLATGDLYGTGTISSDRRDSNGEKTGLGCLLERMLPQNQLSSTKADGVIYLEDGDEVVMEGWCRSARSGDWFGFGECRARILPALSLEGAKL